jgi:hypothetical protein
VVVGLAALTLLLARGAHADTLLAEASWPPPRLPEPMQPVAGPRVMLRVDNANGRLQQYTPLRWRDVCIAPCGLTVDPAATYRIGGGSSMASDTFMLPRSSGDVYIDAQVGSKVKHWVGLGLMIGGAVAALYGVFAWTIFNNVADNANDPQAANDVSNIGRTFGIICISVGAVLEVVGVTMFASSTSVQVR